MRTWRVVLVGLASITLAVSAISAARAVVEEVEAYDSLIEMTRAADAVVLGRVVSAERGRQWTDGCGNTAATLEVEAVLSAGDIAVPGRLTLEYYDCVTLQLGAEIPAERALFFLRNKGVDTQTHRPDAEADEVQRESQFWRLVILAGTIIDRSELAHVPETQNAPFLQKLEGRPFADVLDEVRGYGIPPETSTVDVHVILASSPLPVLLMVGFGAFLVFATTRMRRRPTAL